MGGGGRERKGRGENKDEEWGGKEEGEGKEMEGRFCYC